MPQVRPVEKIQRAARYFATRSRDAHKIADAFGVSVETIRRWSKTPEWTQALDAINYTGDRSFVNRPTRDTIRDADAVFKKARRIYRAAQRAGVPKYKLASQTAKKTGLTRRRVHGWAKKYGW